MDFLEILLESRAVAARHLDDEERQQVIDRLAQLGDIHKVFIQDRLDKGSSSNKDWIKICGADKQQAIEHVAYNLQPRNILTVVRNRNKPGHELYLGYTIFNGKKTMIKFELTDKKAEFISFHNCGGLIQVDYSEASDFQENNLIKEWADKWVFEYNKKQLSPQYKVKVEYADYDTIKLSVADLQDMSELRNFLSMLVKTMPRYLYELRENGMYMDDEGLLVFEVRER